MGMSGWSVAVLTAASALWLASGVERERPVLSAGASANIERLEASVSAHPDNARAVRDLSQAYLEARSPGLAMSIIQHAPASVQRDPWVDHTYARALLDQGRAEQALKVERRVLNACSIDQGSCDTWLLASATRRADILEELVHLGVEDAQAHPEASAIAYQNATREARLAVVE
jgi:predicted Zn-dependent protease